MKTTLTAAFTALTFVIVSCDDNKSAVPHDHDGDGKPDHGPGEHGKAVPHDHDGDGIPDHGPGEHGKAIPHDHDGDGIPDHGPGEHGKPVPHDHDGDGKPDHGPGEHHHPKKVAGPNGGKIMSSPDFKNELFVTADRLVRITFLDKDNKAVAIGTQEVGIVGGDRSDPTTLTFSKAPDGMSLISSAKLPEGKNIPIIITVKTGPDAPAARASMSLDLSDCPTCKYKEYACTCDHGHGDHKH